MLPPGYPRTGAIFESWVVSEIYKIISHKVEHPSLFHYRKTRGPEIDLPVEYGQELEAVEAKSGATISEERFFQESEDIQSTSSF